jgi:hypothetical protein
MILPASPNMQAIITLVICLCFILLTIGVFARKRIIHPPDYYRRCDIAIRGKFILDHRSGGDDNIEHLRRNVKMTLHFPEIPVDLDFAGKDMLIDDYGNFTVRLTFFCAGTPRYVGIDVDGRSLPLMELTGKPLQCSVPDIAVPAEGEGKGAEF